MLGSNAQVRLTTVWTDAAFDYVWAAVGVATLVAGSAMQLWAGAMRSAPIRSGPGDRSPVIMSTMRFWYLMPYHSPYGAATAWVGTWPAMMLWRDALGGPKAWWLPPASGAAERDNPLAPWAVAFAAAGLAAMRAWSAPVDARPPMAVHWQPTPLVDQQPSGANPYSAYRTDGGHAAAQITVAQFDMNRARRPCESSSATQRRRPTSFH